MSARACANPIVVTTPVSRQIPRVSVGKSPEVLHVQFPDAHAARAAFQHRWTAFLHENWQNHVQVAAMVGVSEKAARAWWIGETCPQGWAVSFANEKLGLTIPFRGRT